MASADRLIEVFNEAKARPAGAERDLFLAETCRDEPALKQQVLSLLQAHEGAGDFLTHTQFIPPVSPLTEKSGDKIGRYKLLEQIGEGGCGVVYMAEQEEPVRRRVALKVNKLGMDTKQVIARFEAERQALALMDHPNIAKVLDAGATEAGRPYFVMELVRGIKITDYCDQNNLSTNERLELFIQVCQAIQHAHQKGIIHRDIKPSNILVTQHDDVAVPKVIDFGIAKATTGQLTDKTVFTAFAQFIGTPAYMSPEQAQMSGLDVDTRADIYSLGVLLYELLTGNTPFDAKELLAAGMDEMRRKIREDEPIKPSTCLSTMEATALTAVARQRHVEPPKLIHLIRGDLDWLVMKCLEKDRSRRYETANGLAADIQRHLDNEPVNARPPSAGYRFQKLVRRNKLAFAAATAVATALVLGVVASSWQALRATRAEQEQIKLREEAEAERKKAQSEAAKSQQVARFLEDMLNGVGPSVALGRDTTMLREILDKTAERVGRELTNQPLVEAELRSAMGSTYLQLNETDKAEVMEREALRLRISILGETNESVAASLNNLARVQARQGQTNLPQAEITIRTALAMRRKLLGNERPEVASSLALLAGVLHRQGKLAEAETASREALAIRRKSLGNEHFEVASSLDNLALILQAQGNLPEAEANVREALSMQRKLLGESAPDVATSLKYLGGVLKQEGKLAEAETAYRETWVLHRKLYPDNHPATAEVCSALIGVLNSQGKTAEAKKLSLEELTRQKKVAGSEVSSASVQALTKLGWTLHARGQSAEAEATFHEAVDMARKVFGDGHAAVADALHGLGATGWALEKRTDAETAYRAELAIRRKTLGNDDIKLVVFLHDLGDFLYRSRKPAEAEPFQREALAMRRKVLAPDDQAIAESLDSLARSLLGQRKYADAEPFARECLAIRENKLPDSWLMFSARSILGGSLLGQNRLGEAEPLLISGHEGMKQRDNKITGHHRYRIKESLQRLEQLSKDKGQPEAAAEWKRQRTAFDKAEAEKKRAAAKP